MDEHRSAEPVGDLPAPPPPRSRRRRLRLPDPGAVPGVPPVPDLIAGSVDPDTPFRRDEPRTAEPDDDPLSSWPAPPPPAVGPLPAPPPPRPVDPSASAGSGAWEDHDGGAWQQFVAPEFTPSDEPFAAPRRRRPPWRLLAGALVLAVAVLGGLSALDGDDADTVVDRRPPSFAEQPAVDEQP